MTKTELIELLEVERYTPSPRPPRTTPRRPEPVPDWTPEEQAEHRVALLDALSDDAVVVAWRERGAA